MTVVEAPTESVAARTVARLLIGPQMFFWAGHLLVLVLLLVAGAKHGGRRIKPSLR